MSWAPIPVILCVLACADEARARLWSSWSVGANGGTAELAIVVEVEQIREEGPTQIESSQVSGDYVDAAVAESP